MIGLAILIRGRAAYSGTSFLELTGSAISFGILVGLSVGALRPFTAHYWASFVIAVVGTMITIAFLFVLIFGTSGMRETEPRTVIALLVGSFLVGLRSTALIRRDVRSNGP